MRNYYELYKICTKITLLILTQLIFSGNATLLSLDTNQLYNRYLCAEHFSPDSFMSQDRNKLVKTAVPYKFNSDDHPSSSGGKGTKKK